MSEVTAMQIIGHCVGQRGFMEHVADVGTLNVQPVDPGPLTESQAYGIDRYVKDPEMIAAVANVQAVADKIEAKYQFKLRPWIDAQEL